MSESIPTKVVLKLIKNMDKLLNIEAGEYSFR